MACDLRGLQAKLVPDLAALKAGRLQFGAVNPKRLTPPSLDGSTCLTTVDLIFKTAEHHPPETVLRRASSSDSSAPCSCAKRWLPGVFFCFSSNLLSLSFWQ